MNGHTENKKNTYAHLDRLSTEALEELLCADIKSPDDDDDEVVLHILEVIEQREKAIPTGRLSDADLRGCKESPDIFHLFLHHAAS